jgi:hypothetical protein
MEQVLGKSSEDILANPKPGGRALTTAERRDIDLSGTISGWGSDLDARMRPGVPMDGAPGIGVEALYPQFEQQVPRHKVHKSTEHAKLTPVFGNVCPPRGVSGKIRDLAFRFSEGRLSHWLLLMFADRVDVVEEFVVDLAHLRIPNIPQEMGFGASLKYDRKRLIRNTALFSAGVLALWAFRRSRK